MSIRSPQRAMSAICRHGVILSLILVQLAVYPVVETGKIKHKRTTVKFLSRLLSETDEVFLYREKIPAKGNVCDLQTLCEPELELSSSSPSTL